MKNVTTDFVAGQFFDHILQLIAHYHAAHVLFKGFGKHVPRPAKGRRGFITSTRVDGAGSLRFASPSLWRGTTPHTSLFQCRALHNLTIPGSSFTQLHNFLARSFQLCGTWPHRTS